MGGGVKAGVEEGVKKLIKTLLLGGGVKEVVKKVRKKIWQNLKRCKQLLAKIVSNVVPIRSKNNNINSIQVFDITFFGSYYNSHYATSGKYLFYSQKNFHVTFLSAYLKGVISQKVIPRCEKIVICLFVNTVYRGLLNSVKIIYCISDQGGVKLFYWYISIGLRSVQQFDINLSNCHNHIKIKVFDSHLAHLMVSEFNKPLFIID